APRGTQGLPRSGVKCEGTRARKSRAARSTLHPFPRRGLQNAWPGTCVRGRTYVRMIACIAIPGFELRAALRSRPRLALRPAALAPEEGSEPLLGPVTAAAEAAGVRPGMRLG